MAKKKVNLAPKESDDDLVDMDIASAGGVPSGATIEDAVGALDWLFGPLESGGGGDDHPPDDSLDPQANTAESLDFGEELGNAALGYGAAQDGRRDERLRWIASNKAAASIEDFFGGDDDALYLADAARVIVRNALADSDPWSLEWIFGASYLSNDDTPPRNELLEFFGAKEIVLQTRVQYQMLLDSRSYELAFQCKGLDRVFIWQLSSILRENEQMLGLEHAMVIMESLWKHPGIAENDLWELYKKDIVTRGGAGVEVEPSLPIFESILVYLDMAYVFSKNSLGGWHFTGRNPARQIEEMRKDLMRFNLDTTKRGWSGWW